jgi:hypothetical protein
VVSAVARLAVLLNNTEDATKYQARQSQLESAWESTFFNTSSQRYYDPLWPNVTAIGWENGQLPVQTAQALGIALGLDADHARSAGAVLADDVEVVWGVHQTTGWPSGAS